MNRLPILLFGCCVLAGAAPAQEIRISMTSAPATSPQKAPGRAYSHWTVFEHPRFGYELPVPPGVRASGHPGLGAQATFVSGDGAFKITAWGGLSPQPAATLLETEWRNAQRQAGRMISYGSKGPAWFVVSGTMNGRSRFYEKLITRGDHVAAFSVSWPQSRTREFAPWVQKIENGFTLISDPEYGEPEIAAHVLTNSSGASAAMTDVLDPVILEELRQAELRAESIPQPDTRPPWDSSSQSSTTVDVTPPAKLRVADQRTDTVAELTGPAAPPDTPLEPPKQSTPPPAELPVGEPVPGKKGFVYSPFLAEKMLVDAVDIPSGTKVKCPYTEKVFRLP